MWVDFCNEELLTWRRQIGISKDKQSSWSPSNNKPGHDFHSDNFLSWSSAFHAVRNPPLLSWIRCIVYMWFFVTKDLTQGSFVSRCLNHIIRRTRRPCCSLCCRDWSFSQEKMVRHSCKHLQQPSQWSRTGEEDLTTRRLTASLWMCLVLRRSLMEASHSNQLLVVKWAKVGLHSPPRMSTVMETLVGAAFWEHGSPFLLGPLRILRQTMSLLTRTLCRAWARSRALHPGGPIRTQPMKRVKYSTREMGGSVV